MDHFRQAKYDQAIDAFLDLDINPAKVVALYPESVAGRLSVSQDEWIPLYGGPKPKQPEPPSTPPTTQGEDAQKPELEGGPASMNSPSPLRGTPPQGSIRGVLKTGLEGLVFAGKDDDTASIRSVRRPPKPGTCVSRSPLKSLLRFTYMYMLQITSIAPSKRSCAISLIADPKSRVRSLPSISRPRSRMRCHICRLHQRRTCFPFPMRRFLL